MLCGRESIAREHSSALHHRITESFLYEYDLLRSARRNRDYSPGVSAYAWDVLLELAKGFEPPTL